MQQKYTFFILYMFFHEKNQFFCRFRVFLLHLQKINQLLFEETMKKKVLLRLFVVAMFLCLAGCRPTASHYKKNLKDHVWQSPSLTIFRYEDVLFNLDTAGFQSELKRFQPDYMPFLEGDLDNEILVGYLKDFVMDPSMRDLYNKVKSSYPDLKFVESTVASVFRHFNYYYPDIKLPDTVFTCVSGINPEIPPVQIVGNNLIVSLDWYLSQDEIYNRIGMPLYRSVRTVPQAIGKDIAMQLYYEYVYQWRKQGDLLAEMMNMGRVNFFVEALCPDLADKDLLGYSEEQMKWAQENEGELWADIVGNQRLYTTGLDMYLTFFGDGPFTQEYSNDAPARLGEFVGLQIVRAYVSKNETTLQQLMAENDLQAVFQTSGYKPRK